jgi:hypothetical protein
MTQTSAAKSDVIEVDPQHASGSQRTGKPEASVA